MEGKRKRSSNFTAQEKRLLNRIIEKYLYIVENKKTDNATNKLKESAWEKLTDEFNRESSFEERTGRSLKNCFENSKRRSNLLNKQGIYSDEDSNANTKQGFQIHKQEPPDDENDESESDHENGDFITAEYLSAIIPPEIEDLASKNKSTKYRKCNEFKQKKLHSNLGLQNKQQQLADQEFKNREEQHKLTVQLVQLKMEAQRAKILYYNEKTRTLQNNTSH